MVQRNRFVFIVPMRNASKTLAQMLHSLHGQSYDTWRAVLIDDVSDRSELQKMRQTIEHFRALDTVDDRFTVICNDQRRWEMANVLTGLAFCDDDSIVCRIDADDFLSDLDALRILNDVYNAGHDCVWTAHRWFDDERVTSFNISGPLQPNDDPYRAKWVSSHLKTFRRRLITGVNDQNFRGQDGEYIKRAGDQALYLPVLKRAQNRTYLPMVMYAYRCCMRQETFATADATFQKDEAEFLRSRGFVE